MTCIMEVIERVPLLARPAVRSGIQAAILSCALLYGLPNSTAHAQAQLPDVPDPDPALEMAELELAEGFEINLFAADPRIAKPIQMNFDAAGRLWVASSEVYPHIAPGQEADDKILVLEDADGDGVAEKTTVFAGGLLIPTAVIPGDGGAYVANSTELLHFADDDGDLQADRRRIVLSGFGTEDTHHLIHTLRWGYDGRLYFNQSIYIHSHIETPHGVRRLAGGGVWQLRPETLELNVMATGLINPWGFHYDRWGQCFLTDGAGGEGINYVFPGAAFPTAVGASRVLHGLNPGSPKYCGLEVVSGRHLPDDWQQNLITCDFRAHRVCRFALSDAGSGYASRELPELIRSTHPAFRPVDVKLGPDGAIYIADWYNPIIQHGEVDFRDPRRDHTHGRIWRLTYKGRPLVERPQLSGATTADLLEALKAPEDWTRHFARLELRAQSKQADNTVLSDLATWVEEVSANEEYLLEALWTYQTLREPNLPLLEKLASADDARVRAAAARVAGNWRELVRQPLRVLPPLAKDQHPRVRLEAVCALRAIGTNEAFLAAMQALDYPLDENLDFALWQTARELAPVWLPGVGTTSRPWRGSVDQLIFALLAVDSPESVPLLMQLLGGDKVPGDREQAVIELIGRHGNAEQLRQLAERILADTAQPAVRRAERLNKLVAATRQSKSQPQLDAQGLAPLLAEPPAAMQAAAARAAGAWKLADLAEPLRNLAANSEAAPAVRTAALEALADLGGTAGRDTLANLAATAKEPQVRLAATTAMARIDLKLAAWHAAELLMAADAALDPTEVLQPFLAQKRGPAHLTEAIEASTLRPDVAKLAVRAVQSSPQPDEALLSALRTAGGLAAGPQPPTPEELAALVRDVADHGNPALGQQIYRRRDLQCQKCHAIGGAGGLVGPDLLSIGASAPVDYLVESILEPNKKIKENYHSLIVVTDEGQIVNGVLVRETDTELLLRDAEGRVQGVPLKSIEQRAQGQSLMPVGAAEALTRDELVHLVAFMSRLGKGEYAVGSTSVVRSWETLQMTPEAIELLRRTRIGTAAGNDPALTWEPVYSLVSGELPVAELPQLSSNRGKFVQIPAMAIVRFHEDLDSPGEKKWLLNSTDGLTMWLDGQPLELTGPEVTAKLDRGRHTITLAVDVQQRSAPLRIERK